MYLVVRKIKESDFEKGTVLKGVTEVSELKDGEMRKGYETEADAICEYFKECINTSLEVSVKGKNAFYLLLRELFHRMSSGKLTNEVPWFRVVGLALDSRIKRAVEGDDIVLEDEVYKICYPLFKIPFEQDRVVDYEEVMYFEKLLSTLCSLAIVKDGKYSGIQQLPLLQIANNFCAMFQCRLKEVKKQKITWCGERDLFVNFVNYCWGTIRRYTGLPVGCIINPIKCILREDTENGCMHTGDAEGVEGALLATKESIIQDGNKCLQMCKGAGRFDDYKPTKFKQAIWVNIENCTAD